MVESFLGKNKGSNFIEGTKIMKNFSDNNKNGSSIFQGKIREQDFSAEQKLNELKAAVEELARQDLLRRLECERQASSCIDEISSQAELHIGEEGDEGYFNYERTLWNFFEPLFNLFEVDVDPKIYQMLKEKKEKNWLLSIIKFMRDKLKELIKKIFARDLSFDQRLDKEIKELEEKLFGGGLSKEEEVAILERLEALRGLKLKLQLAVVGWIVTMFAEIFGVELAAVAEASKEKEDKKAEKTSLKEEATKEVRKDVEIKVDEREKPKVPVSLFEVSPGFVRPVVLSKPELDLLPKPMKELMPKEVIKEEIREVKETKPKVEEEKKAKPEPKKEVCPQKTSGQSGANMTREGQDKWSEASDHKSKKINLDSGNAKKPRRIPTPVHDYPIGHYQAPSGTTDNEKSNADQRSSASDAKENPKSKVTDVLNERAARGNGNTPSR
ncbi:hypothetical protein [Wolbachia endosymbiont (group A) of Bibio marci]|uniref:hypothetical protein n=1 Tax=Wolbachia endosymbiont (group A) of Bibio marci TaxID=2953987 RepID=UPI00222EA626|nr:hypothetical protein [Wolbachia endosymbiont (group A) of Bibio marci]